MRAKRLITGSVVVAFGIAAMACSQRPRTEADWLIDRFSARLDLTETQRSLVNELGGIIQELRQEMRRSQASSREEMHAIFSHDELDQAQLLELVQPYQIILDEYAPKVAEKVVVLHNSLSTEQKSKIGKIIDKRLGQRRKSAFGRKVRRQVNTLP